MDIDMDIDIDPIDGFPLECPTVYKGVDPELTAGGDHAHEGAVWPCKQLLWGPDLLHTAFA